MRKDKRGYIVVETLISFMLFALLMFSILSLINIVAVQARVHYALTQTANTVSMYCYTLEATGVAGHLTNMSGRAETVQGEADQRKTNINGVITGIKDLSVDKTVSSGKAVISQAEGWADAIETDPKNVMQSLMSAGLQEGENYAFSLLVRSLMGRYLSNGRMTGDEYLRSFGVSDGLDGLQFYDFSLFDLNSIGANDSTLLTSDGNVKIVVQYDVDYAFGALPLPFAEPKLHITQEAITQAWLSGEGEGYKK